jgi:hypothetical protein
VHLFPTLDTTGMASAAHCDALDTVAKDWGFSFKYRAFVIGGCGMDMVFALIDGLAHKAGLPSIPHVNKAMNRFSSGNSYANRVRHTSFSR